MEVRQITSAPRGIGPEEGLYLYAPVGQAPLGSALSTEASGQTVYRSAGVLSGMMARCLAGDRTSMTIRSRVNGAYGNCSLAITGAGEYEDLTGSDTISAGATISYEMYGGTGGTTDASYSSITTKWAATGTTVNHLVGRASNPYPGSTTYSTPGGMNWETQYTLAQWLVKLPPSASSVTLRNLYVCASANTRAESITVTVEGASGAGTAPICIITAGSTTAVEDTSNSILLLDGDLLTISVFSNLDIGGTITLLYQFEVQSDQRVWHLVAGANSNGGVQIPLGEWSAVSGQLDTTTTESAAKTRVSLPAVTISNVSANVVTPLINSELVLRADEADVGSGSTISVDTSTATGWQTDSANSYTTIDGEHIDYAFNSPPGNVVLTCITATVSPAPAALALPGLEVVLQAMPLGATW